MAKSPSNIAFLSEILAGNGLVIFGGLKLSINECAADSVDLVGKNALLIGNAGSDMWGHFSKSAEYSDGSINPMNRWTKRTLDGVAEIFKGRVVYPFDEPYWPFQRLAQKAAGVKSSPLGILIHPELGLWHAFRGMLVFENTHDFSSQINALIAADEMLNHPCDTCLDKPCLTACPVGAFTGERLDVQTCFSHLDTKSTPNCMSLGCQARCACPIAKEHHYDGAQIQFHMKSYRGK